MTISATLRRLAPLAISAATLIAAAAPTAANADVVWTVTGTFDDGGTLSGTFDINQYGFLEGFDLLTTAGSALNGYEYSSSHITDYISTYPTAIDIQPLYQNDLHLEFTYSLSNGVPNNPILTGSQSYECANSYGCGTADVGDHGAIRYLNPDAQNFASAAVVPEPTAWALMIVGFGMAGGLLRARRKAVLA